MAFSPKFRAAIAQHYKLDIQSAIPGPRQKMARTYILDVKDGARLFCKLIDKPGLIPLVRAGLPILDELHKTGAKRIAYPIPSDEGLSLSVEGTLILLFNYIAAPQSYDYSLHAFGRLMADIHMTGRSISGQGECELDPEPTLQKAEKGCADAHKNAQLADVLRRHEETIRLYARKFQDLAPICRETPKRLTVTHGDAPGNVLMRAPEDLYLIDWDEIEVSPPERDHWIMDHFPEYLEGYKSVDPGFEIDPDLRAYYILKYFFRSLNFYFDEIYADRMSAHEKQDWIRDLEDNLISGWMRPKLDEVLFRRESREENPPQA